LAQVVQVELHLAVLLGQLVLVLFLVLYLQLAVDSAKLKPMVIPQVRLVLEALAQVVQAEWLLPVVAQQAKEIKAQLVLKAQVTPAAVVAARVLLD
jgi:hypothetical protein